MNDGNHLHASGAAFVRALDADTDCRRKVAQRRFRPQAEVAPPDSEKSINYGLNGPVQPVRPERTLYSSPV